MKKLTEYASGNFLKAVNVSSEKDAFIVTNAEETKAKDKTGKEYEVLRLTLENNSVEYEFDLNKTNIKFLVSKGFVEPMTLVSKKLFFKKALVRNPNTNMEVEGLRICDVQ
jgi:tmRNA-binding protein